MAPGNRRSSRMRFFEEHSFRNEHADPIEDDGVLVCQNVSSKSANIRGLYY